MSRIRYLRVCEALSDADRGIAFLENKCSSSVWVYRGKGQWISKYKENICKWKYIELNVIAVLKVEMRKNIFKCKYINSFSLSNKALLNHSS